MPNINELTKEQVLERLGAERLTVSICPFCKFWSAGACSAFPEGVLRKYITGALDHKTIDPKQVGTDTFALAGWAQGVTLDSEIQKRVKDSVDG